MNTQLLQDARGSLETCLRMGTNEPNEQVAATIIACMESGATYGRDIVALAAAVARVSQREVRQVLRDRCEGHSETPLWRSSRIIHNVRHYALANTH